MSQLVWKNGKNIGIALDDETNSICLFAGNTSILIDGESGKVVTQGATVENNGGDRTEDLMLKKTASIEAVIPSTTVTPVPQATVDLPFRFVGGLASDVWTMITNVVR